MTTFVRPRPHRRSPAAQTGSPALVRYVTDGLLATIEAYRTGTLPLHRFAWELAARIDSLSELDPPALVLTRLRWLQRGVELLHAGSAGRTRGGGHTRLTEGEENSLTVTLVGLSTTLAALNPDSPLDPSGAARPAEAPTSRRIA